MIVLTIKIIYFLSFSPLPPFFLQNQPVGHGILTMPQRSENNLYLWNQDKPEVPVHAFKGHKDVVKEFVWRMKGGGHPDIGMHVYLFICLSISWLVDRSICLKKSDFYIQHFIPDDREFQLITCSKDQNLRLWPISDKQLKVIFF